MLEQLRRAASALDVPVEDAEGEVEPGKTAKVLVLKHGKHNLTGIDKKRYVFLLYPMDIGSEDGALLARQPPDLLERLYLIVKPEMAEGRTAYALIFGEKEPKVLQQIRVEQKIVVADNRPETVQRLADGIQEVVVAAVRCQLVLGQALRDVRASTAQTTDTYYKGMYA